MNNCSASGRFIQNNRCKRCNWCLVINTVVNLYATFMAIFNEKWKCFRIAERSKKFTIGFQLPKNCASIRCIAATLPTAIFRSAIWFVKLKQWLASKIHVLSHWTLIFMWFSIILKWNPLQLDTQFNNLIDISSDSQKKWTFTLTHTQHKVEARIFPSKQTSIISYHSEPLNDIPYLEQKHLKN